MRTLQPFLYAFAFRIADLTCIFHEAIPRLFFPSPEQRRKRPANTPIAPWRTR